jgi:hypothetical protein
MDSAVDDANRRDKTARQRDDDEHERIAQLNKWHGDDQSPSREHARENDNELMLERGF